MKNRVYIIISLLLITTRGYTQIQNNGNLKMFDGSTVGLFGSFTNNGSFNDNEGTIYLVGAEPQTFNGDSVINVENLILNKSVNNLQLDNELQISGNLTFSNGIIRSDRTDSATEFVHFLHGSSYSGASDDSHVNGVIRKTGNESFSFPVGNGSLLRPIGISNPSTDTDHYTTFYKAENPDSLYNRNSLELGLHHVSGIEYWILERTGGVSDVEITLSWGANSSDVTALCDLKVAKWDGSQWTNEGNGGVSGTNVLGSVVSGGSCSTPSSITGFGPFTLGSSSIANVLPITLLSFVAIKGDNAVNLQWQTASEKNNDFFTIERSSDGYNWIEIEDIPGAGNSNRTIGYSAIDYNPLIGFSYYRLKQTDFDGKFTYSQIESMNFDEFANSQISIYPNPTFDQITISGINLRMNELEIYNSQGQRVDHQINIGDINENNIVIDLSMLPSGIYFFKTKSASKRIIKK